MEMRDSILREIFGRKLNRTIKSPELIGAIIDFFNLYLSAGNSEYHQFSSILAGKSPDFMVKWLPESGCALLSVKNESRSVIFLQLVILDGWICNVRSEVMTGRQIISDSNHYRLIWAGEIPYPLYDAFMAAFCNTIQTKKDRNILNALHIASKAINASFGPTSADIQPFCAPIGVNSRSVSWCLVKAVVGVLISNYPYLTSSTEDADHFSCEKLMINFYLWILEEEMDKLDHITVDRIDLTMSIISCICNNCSLLAESDCTVSEFETRCKSIRQRLEDDAKKTKKKWNLQKIASAGGHEDTGLSELGWANFDLNLPPPIVCSTANADFLSVYRKRIDQNLCTLNSVPDDTCAIEVMISWIQNIDESIKSRSIVESEGRQLAISSIQHWLYKRLEIIDDVGSKVSVQALKSIWNLHNSQCFSLTALLKEKDSISVELRSNEMLSTWIIFCLSHASVKRIYPIIATYGVPIRWSDLRHLSLGSKAAVDAALAVSTYLERYSSPNNDIFSLSTQDPTSNMALQFSRENAIIQKKWKQEEEAADTVQTKHWNQVRKLQAEAAELRILIAKCNVKLSDLLRKSSEMEILHPAYGYTHLSLEIQSARAKLSKLSGELAAAERPLPVIFQPLPKDEKTAMVILFFIYMPVELRIFSTICVVAQQMLLPQSPSTATQEGMQIVHDVISDICSKM